MNEPFPPEINDEQQEEGIFFQNEDVSLELNDSSSLVHWIEQVITTEDKTLKSLNFIFCSDAYLHQINVEYLQHDTLTDIITFPYSRPPIIEGDIFISIDRIKENASTFNTSFENELHRVIIHGVLHLCGYLDKTPKEKKEMRAKEDGALALLHNLL